MTDPDVVLEALVEPDEPEPRPRTQLVLESLPRLMREQPEAALRVLQTARRHWLDGSLDCIYETAFPSSETGTHPIVSWIRRLAEEDSWYAAGEIHQLTFDWLRGGPPEGIGVAHVAEFTARLRQHGHDLLGGDVLRAHSAELEASAARWFAST